MLTLWAKQTHLAEEELNKDGCLFIPSFASNNGV